MIEDDYDVKRFVSNEETSKTNPKNSPGRFYVIHQAMRKNPNFPFNSFFLDSLRNSESEEEKNDFVDGIPNYT